MNELTAYEGSDFYCDVAAPRSGQLDVVYEDDRILAFHHTRPSWATHIVVIPKRHLDSLTTVTTADSADLLALFKVVQQVARRVEDTEGAAAVLTNLGDYQDSKHLHIHIHSGEHT